MKKTEEEIRIQRAEFRKKRNKIFNENLEIKTIVQELKEWFFEMGFEPSGQLFLDMDYNFYFNTEKNLELTKRRLQQLNERFSEDEKIKKAIFSIENIHTLLGVEKPIILEMDSFEETEVFLNFSMASHILETIYSEREVTKKRIILLEKLILNQTDKEQVEIEKEKLRKIKLESIFGEISEPEELDLMVSKYAIYLKSSIWEIVDLIESEIKKKIKESSIKTKEIFINLKA